jgi:hypothetical protein
MQLKLSIGENTTECKPNLNQEIVDKIVECLIARFVVESVVESVETHGRASLRVYINETQYFYNVPEIAWNFYIGDHLFPQISLKYFIFFEYCMHECTISILRRND